MPRNRKGSRRERELATRLDEAGFAVLRAPASGSATERELPDVLAGDGTHTYAIEAKASGGDPIYLDEAEVEALQHFADAFGATALVGARFDYHGWAFFAPAQLYRTDSGNYRVKKERIETADGIDALAEVDDV